MARVAIVGATGMGLVFTLARQPQAGETVLADALHLTPGGKASNHALGLALFGHDVSLISAVGCDTFAEQIRKVWRAHGIDVSGVVSMPEAPTLVGAVLTDRLGDNRVAIGPSALAQFSTQHVEDHAAAIESADLLLVSLEMPVPPAVRALEIARTAGVTTVLNPAPAPPKRAVPQLLSLSDWVTPNEGEAETMSGISTNMPQIARVLRQLGASNIVVTLGQSGAFCLTDDTPTRVPAPTVHAVDTSGAGDAFNTAFVDALLRGKPPLEAVASGCAAGARIVQGPGFLDSLYLLEDLLPQGPDPPRQKTPTSTRTSNRADRS